MRPLNSLRVKLILAFVGLMLIAITGMALYGYFFARTALYGQALERSSHQVHLQAESIVSSLKQAGGDALYLSVLRSLKMLRTLRHEPDADDQIAVWERKSHGFLDVFVCSPHVPGAPVYRCNGDRNCRCRGRRAENPVFPDPGIDRSTANYFQWMTGDCIRRRVCVGFRSGTGRPQSRKALRPLCFETA